MGRAGRVTFLVVARGLGRESRSWKGGRDPTGGLSGPSGSPMLFISASRFVSGPIRSILMGTWFPRILFSSCVFSVCRKEESECYNNNVQSEASVGEDRKEGNELTQLALEAKQKQSKATAHDQTIGEGGEKASQTQTPHGTAYWLITLGPQRPSSQTSSLGSVAILIWISVSFPWSRSAREEKAAWVRSTCLDPTAQPAQVSTMRTKTHLVGPLQTVTV